MSEVPEINYDCQEGMERWMKDSLGDHSSIYRGGIIPMMKPTFERCSYQDRKATISFQVEKWELNPENIMHGGLIVTAMDTSFGMLCHYYARQKMITTVTISTTFLKPVDYKDKMEITTYATSIGRTLVSLTAEVHLVNKNNLLAATGNTTFMILNKEFPTPLP